MNRFFNIAGIFSGIVGGGFFFVFFFLIQMSLAMSIVLGLAGLGGAYTFIYAFRPKNRIEFNMGGGVTPELITATLKEGNEKMRILGEYAQKVSDPKVSGKINQIIEVIRRIFENFKQDPNDIKYAKQFLSYYLDTSIRIVKKYIDLSSQNVQSPEIAATLAKAVNMLDSIEKAFEKQQARLLRDDAMDLDVEIETLERTFSSEDLK
jgi:5-bromo-4-chloroindolyl phosphate hydrolysis protein